MVKNTTIKVNLIFTFPKKTTKEIKKKKLWWIKILINIFISPPSVEFSIEFSVESKVKWERIDVKSAKEEISEMCFCTEDGLSAHLSCLATRTRTHSLARPTRQKHPSMAKATNISPNSSEEFIYHFYYIAYRKKIAVLFSFGYFLISIIWLYFFRGVPIEPSK